jgi:hypothetical protein
MKPLSRTIWTSSLALALVATLLVFGSFAFANNDDSDHHSKFSVDPQSFDPHRTHLVAAQWIDGTGCPTGAKEVLFDTNPPYALLPPSAFTDTACPTGDPKDKENEGLLFVKTGELYNDAAGTAVIRGVRGIVLGEIGYDIRSGSHCGAGAPRFNITTTTGKFYFLGCTSPAPDSTPFSSTGWRRLRWGNGTPGSVSGYLNGSTLEAITDPIRTISMIFDEAQDALSGGNSSGLAVLDNIDINGTLVGRDASDDHSGHYDHNDRDDHDHDDHDDNR